MFTQPDRLVSLQLALSLQVCALMLFVYESFYIVSRERIL